MRSFFMVSTALAVGLLGCDSDAAEERYPASEHGRWVLLAATRDGRPISTLESAFFAFDTVSSQLATNLLREERVMTYRREGSAFVTDGPPELRAFEIGELTDSTLTLSSRIQGSRFAMALVPAPLDSL